MKNTILALGNFYGGLSGKTKEDFVRGNVKFISYMNVYNNPSVNIDCQDFVSVAEGEKQNSIRYGDVLFTGSSETAIDCGMSSVVTEEPKEPIFLNSFCFGYRFNDLSKIEPNFIKHYFRCKSLRKQIAAAAFGVTRFNLSKKDFGKIQIHIPNKTLQERIANQLDTFTTLISRLESELELRQKQYEHYREVLLNFEGDEEVEWKKLGEFCDIGTGNNNKEDAVADGLYPFFVRSKEVFRINKYLFDEEAIIIPGEGGIGEIFHYANGKYGLHQRAYRIHPKRNTYSCKYIYYYLVAFFKFYITQKSVSATVTSIRKPMLEMYSIPIPSKHRQQQIVSQLDTFEQLIAALKREIALRKKQYEYYREKLLTFDE